MSRIDKHKLKRQNSFKYIKTKRPKSKDAHIYYPYSTRILNRQQDDVDEVDREIDFDWDAWQEQRNSWSQEC